MINYSEIDISHKSWNVTSPPQKKYLSQLITYNLSRWLNKKKFEVVFEGYLDLYTSASEQPDVVIYSLQERLTPIIAIELCSGKEIFENQLLAKRMVETYSVKEFFIYDYENHLWWRISKGSQAQISISEILAFDLAGTTTF